MKKIQRNWQHKVHTDEYKQNTICVGRQYTQTSTYNINKTSFWKQKVCISKWEITYQEYRSTQTPLSNPHSGVTLLTMPHKSLLLWKKNTKKQTN